MKETYSTSFTILAFHYRMEDEGTFSEKAGMFTSDNPGKLKSSGIALLTTHHFILY